MDFQVRRCPECGRGPPEQLDILRASSATGAARDRGGTGVAGVFEWSTRLIPAVFSMATTVLLYPIASRRFGRRVGFVAALFYLGAPATVAFGGMPDYMNGQLAFFMLATVETYMRWRETGRQLWLVSTALLFVAGALTDWPMFYVVPILAVHYWFTGGRGVIRALAFVSPPALLLIALVLWMDSIDGDGAFLHQFTVRMSGHGITWRDWVGQVISWNVAWLHTYPVAILSVVYVATMSVLIFRRGFSALRGHEVSTVLVLVAAAHLLIGRTGNMQSWWVVVVTAPVALAAALALDMLVRRFDSHPWVASCIVTATVASFVVSSIPVAYIAVREEWPHTRSAGYAARELGMLIRSVSQPEDGVLTSDYWNEPTLWFYADRQLRTQVISVASLNNSLGRGPYTLAFGYPQNNGEPPRWFVMPPPHRTELRSLAEELDARFQRREMNGYAIYRLY